MERICFQVNTAVRVLFLNPNATLETIYKVLEVRDLLWVEASGKESKFQEPSWIFADIKGVLKGNGTDAEPYLARRIPAAGSLVGVGQTSLGVQPALGDDDVLELLRQNYGASFAERIKASQTSDPRKGPISPDAKGIVPALGTRLHLEGYHPFAKKALTGLLLLQSRSDKVVGLAINEDQNDKFECGTQFLRMVGAPGTGKSTALGSLWRHVYEHIDALAAELRIQDHRPEAMLHMLERIKNSLQPDCFLSFTFTNAGLPRLKIDEAAGRTGDFMATRMLYAMACGNNVHYKVFLRKMDPALRLLLTPSHLMEFIQNMTGIGNRRGLVVFNFDECGVPEPEADNQATYFQKGLSGLVDWRMGEAMARFESGGRERNLLPVVVISGSRSCRMTLLRTGSGRARLFDLGRPQLGDAALLRISMDALKRIADATEREIPEKAEDVLQQQLIPWLGGNPRFLVKMLCTASSSTVNHLHVGRLWAFLEAPPASRRDKLYALLDKVELAIGESNWGPWFSMRGEEQKQLIRQTLAHAITARRVARDHKIPGAGRTWGDAENDGLIALTDGPLLEVRDNEQSLPQNLSDPDLANAITLDAAGPIPLGEQAPDTLRTLYVHAPPLLLRLMYRKLPLDWVSMRSLVNLMESWDDRERSDVGLLMLRMQLAKEVFKEDTLDSDDLCKGLDVGMLSLPTGDYNIYEIKQQLTAASFKEDCLQGATPGSRWAFVGPGNWGPDGWLILWLEDGRVLVLFVQSKLRSDPHRRYPGSALSKEATKCWEVEGEGVVSRLLYLTDERGHGQDNQPLDVGTGVKVVAVSRDAHFDTYGSALQTLKRCRENLDLGRGAKRAKP